MNVKGAFIGLLVVFFVFFFGSVMFMAGKDGQHLQYSPGPSGPTGAKHHGAKGHEAPAAHEAPVAPSPASMEEGRTPDSTPAPVGTATAEPTPAAPTTP